MNEHTHLWLDRSFFPLNAETLASFVGGGVSGGGGGVGGGGDVDIGDDRRRSSTTAS